MFQINRGMVIYICFFKGAMDDILPKMGQLLLLALCFYVCVCVFTGCVSMRCKHSFLLVSGSVSSLLNMRLCESDSGKMVSVLELPGSLLIVPQATLGGKAKGRAMQYHSNISKEDGSRLYSAFVALCEKELLAAAGGGVTVKHGTYGNRQVLKMDTNGPYTHLMEF